MGRYRFAVARRAEAPANVRRVLDRLATLRIDPAARSRAALEALAGATRFDVLYACGSALELHPLPEARPPLLAAFARLEAEAAKLDNDGNLRATILRALRPFLVSDDAALLERAVTTYPRSVQGPGGVELRAAALAGLLAVAPELATAHAARILAEAQDTRRCTQAGTGEPAVTAARVLAAAGETSALFLAACLEWSAPDEVVAECVRQLVDLPVALIVEVGSRAAGRELVELGFVDLVAGHPTAVAAHQPALAAWTRERGVDVYRYALAAFVASREGACHELVLRVIEGEFRRDRLVVAEEALGLARGGKALEDAHRLVRGRLAAGVRPGEA